MPRSSSVEGFGFVFLEASSHGLPVLAHNIGGVSDAVKNGKTGILTDYRKPYELKNEMIKLIKDKNLRKKWGKKEKMGTKSYLE